MGIEVVAKSLLVLFGLCAVFATEAAVEVEVGNDVTLFPATVANVTRISEDMIHFRAEVIGMLSVDEILERVRSVYASGDSAKRTFAKTIENGRVIVSLFDEGKFKALVRNGTNVTQIAPLDTYDDEDRRRMLSDSHSGAEYFAHIPRGLRSDRGKEAGDDSLEVPDEVEMVDRNRAKILKGSVEDLDRELKRAEPGTEVHFKPHARGEPGDNFKPWGNGNGNGPKRRALADSRDPYGYDFTPNCHTKEAETIEVIINIATDKGFYQSMGSSTSNVESELEFMIIDAAEFYYLQLNARLKIGTAIIGTNSNSGLPGFINYARSSNNCPSISSQLSEMRSWSRDLPSDQQAVNWHLITDCHPPPGTVGIAYVGTLCNKHGYNVAVTSRTSTTWKVFAHEVGHSFNAQHSFEEGQGTTGGIMDYGDGFLLGTNLVRFNPKYRRDEVCMGLQQGINTGCPYIRKEAVDCGDGIIAFGEECECKNGGTSCTGCKKCMLTDSSVRCGSRFYMKASATDLVHPDCCLNGDFAPANTYCGSGSEAGTCGIGGVCMNLCQDDGLPFCGIRNKGCQQLCDLQGTCAVFTYLSNNQPISAMPDGTQCVVNGQQGHCENTECIAGPSISAETEAPSPYPTSYPTKFPTPRGGFGVNGRGCIQFSSSGSGPQEAFMLETLGEEFTMTLPTKYFLYFGSWTGEVSNDMKDAANYACGIKFALKKKRSGRAKFFKSSGSWSRGVKKRIGRKSEYETFEFKSTDGGYKIFIRKPDGRRNLVSAVKFPNSCDLPYAMTFQRKGTYGSWPLELCEAGGQSQYT